MALFLFNIIFLALSLLSNIISRVILTTIAYLLVIIIQAFKVPGEALKGGLEQLADVVKTCFEYILQLVMDAASSLLSSLFDFILQGIWSSVVATGSGVGELVDKTRTSLNGLLEEGLLPEILEGFKEMVSTMVSDLWNNCMDAMGHVIEKA